MCRKVRVTIQKKDDGSIKQTKMNDDLKVKQEFGDDLRVGVLNILPDVTTLSSLVAVSLVKVEI